MPMLDDPPSSGPLETRTRQRDPKTPLLVLRRAIQRIATISPDLGNVGCLQAQLAQVSPAFLDLRPIKIERRVQKPPIN
jgi:hypothetical protein